MSVELTKPPKRVFIVPYRNRVQHKLLNLSASNITLNIKIHKGIR